MVAFENVKLNQRVEVEIGDGVYCGTVKYKGGINGQVGDWVGVALDRAYGLHDGMIKGRRYFSCPPSHGIFIDSNYIRFIRSKRCLFNTYRRANPIEAYTENELFAVEKPLVMNRPQDPIIVHRPLYSAMYPLERTFEDDPPPRYHLRHSVSNHIPAAAMLRPKSAGAPLHHNSHPIHTQYDPYSVDFTSKPTIPNTHMPYWALRSQIRRGWETPHVHLVREWSVNNGRDSICRASWNDVSL